MTQAALSKDTKSESDATPNATNVRRGVTLVGERQAMPNLTPTPVPMPSPTTPPPSAAPSSPRSETVYRGQVLAAFHAIATVLAIRLLLLLSGMGAFCLSLLALLNPDVMKLAASVIYDVFIFIPLVVVYMKQQGGK